MLNLFTSAGENTLPEQVEVNKQNIQLLADEIEKLGYTPKGEYSAETEYKYNDVVFYDYKLYAMIKEDGVVVGVLPTNAEYWQAVTGNIRGQQGAQGEQGEQGEDGQDGAAGADGKSALAYTVIHLGSVPQIGGTMELRKAYFTRDPEINEKCVVFVADSFLNRSYIYITEVRIAAIDGETVTVAVQQRYSLQGVQGEAGAPALVYDRKIDFVWNEQSQQLISASLPLANFNRTPNLNEDFVAILHDTVSGVDYLAMGEVQTIVGTNVTSIVANDINRITGINGTNGEDGESALETAEEFSGAADPVLEQTLTMSNLSFNRTPKIHDALIVIYRNATTGDMFVGNVRISVVGEVTTTGYFESVPRKITGNAGASPAKLYLHYITYDHTSIANYNAKLIFTCINSNPNWEDNDNNAGKLNDYLSQCGLNSVDKMLPVNGYIETTQTSNVYKPLIGVYSATSPYRVYVYDNGDGTVGEITTSMGGSMIKITVELQ